MARQIHGQGLKTTAHVKTAVQRPDRVIHAGAVNKEQGRALRCRIAAAGDKGRLPENV